MHHLSVDMEILQSVSIVKHDQFFFSHCNRLFCAWHTRQPWYSLSMQVSVSDDFLMIIFTGRLAELVKRDAQNPGQTIVFCNTVASCDWATAMLSRAGLEVVKLHGSIDGKVMMRARDGGGG